MFENIQGNRKYNGQIMATKLLRTHNTEPTFMRRNNQLYHRKSNSLEKRSIIQQPVGASLAGAREHQHNIS